MSEADIKDERLVPLEPLAELDPDNPDHFDWLLQRSRNADIVLAALRSEVESLRKKLEEAMIISVDLATELAHLKRETVRCDVLLRWAVTKRWQVYCLSGRTMSAGLVAFTTLDAVESVLRARLSRLEDPPHA